MQSGLTKTSLAVISAICLVVGACTQAPAPTSQPVKAPVVEAPKPDIKWKDKDGRTALMNAAHQGDLAQVRALISAGADVNAAADDGSTALINAAGALEHQADCVKALLAAHANVSTQDNKGQTALFYTDDSKDCLNALIAAGADASIKNKEGATVLSMVNDVDSLGIFLNAGAKMNDLDGIVALQRAASTPNPQLLKALIAAGANPKVTKNGISVLDGVGNLECLTILVDAGARYGSKEKGGAELAGAVTKGDAALTKALLMAGASANARDSNGTPVLIDAANVDCAKLLIAAGANKEAAGTADRISYSSGSIPPPFHATALSIAAFYGKADMVKLLLDSKAKKEDMDAYGMTPLMQAASQGQVEVVKMLLAAGASKESREHIGRTPLIVAAGHGQVETVKQLLAAGANKEATDYGGNTALMNAADANEPEFVAPNPGRADCIKALIAAGADVNKKNRQGYTAMSLNGGKDPDIIEILKAAGAKE